MRNGIGLPESVVFAPGAASQYRYRNGMGMIGSAEFNVFMDDFQGSVSTNLPIGWTAAVIDVGSTAVVSTTAVLGATGALLIASDGTDEGVAVYGPKVIQLTAGKRFFMEMRAQTSLAATTDLQFGLSDLTAVVNPEDIWTTAAANLVAFGVLSGSAYPKMLSDKANTGSTVQTGTIAMVDATFTTLAIAYDGANLQGYVNGVLALNWSAAVTTIPTGVALAPFFGFRTGTAAGNVGTVDYVRYVQER